jgi:hypothetical protein
MNAPTTEQIRAATQNVLRLIEETFGKDNQHYIALNTPQYLPRVELEKGVYSVSILHANFKAKDNHRAVAICMEYLNLNKKDEQAV